jgi:O-glycosyl hydrolase
MNIQLIKISKEHIIALCFFVGVTSVSPSSLSAATAAASNTDTLQISINPTAKRQTVEGWGISLCWWANMCGKWSDDKINELVDWLVSPNGLNYNVFRYNIGGGDDPLHRNCTLHHMATSSGGKGLRAEMDGFKDSANASYIWSRDSAQRKIMLLIKKKRPDAIFEAFSNSCPYYMTYSGCCSGNTNASKDNLKPEFYEAFAHYLVDVCKFYKDSFNIEFRTLEPFNEPMTSYWKCGGGQEGCHFDVSSMISFVKVLSPILKASGLHTVISATDETDVAQSIKDYNAFKTDAEAFNAIGQWNTHSYDVNNASRVNLSSLTYANNIPFWMSEVGSGGSGLSGNLSLSQKLMDDIRYMAPKTWVDWQYVEEGNDQWCLVEGNFSASTYKKVKNYYVRQQISRFIKKDYTWLSVLNDQTLAALSPKEDSLVIVVQNNTSENKKYKVDLSLFKSTSTVAACYCTNQNMNASLTSGINVTDKTMSFTVPAYDIRTMILPVVVDSDTQQEGWNNQKKYLLVPHCANLVMQTRNDSLSIQSYIPQDSTQEWVLNPSGSGYTFTSLSGKKLTDTGSYYLSTSSLSKNGQQFAIQSLGEGILKITSLYSGKSLDLEKEAYSSGTYVGLWNYGTSPAASNRHWLLLESPCFNTISTGISSLSDREKEIPFKIYSVGQYLYILKNTLLADIKIYKENGLLIYQDKTQESFLRIPLLKGLYIMSFDQNGFSFSKKIFIKG